MKKKTKKRPKREKLVRDGIEEVYGGLSSRGRKPRKFRIAQSSERVGLLCKKLLEEGREVARAYHNESGAVDELAGELADVKEVLDALLKELGYSAKHIRDLQLSKRARVGGFERFSVMELRR